MYHLQSLFLALLWLWTPTTSAFSVSPAKTRAFSFVNEKNNNHLIKNERSNTFHSNLPTLLTLSLKASSNDDEQQISNNVSSSDNEPSNIGEYLIPYAIAAIGALAATAALFKFVLLDY